MTVFAYPEGHVFYRKLTRSFPRIVRAEGCYVYDDRGKRYLDACGGAFVVNVGHGVAEIADALARQARQVAYLSGTAFTATKVPTGEVSFPCSQPGKGACPDGGEWG